MNDPSIKDSDRLTESIRVHLEEPGADLASLRGFLEEKEGLTPAEADKLSRAVVDRLNRERFPAVTELELLLTEDCDQRCDYCFVEGKGATPPMSSAVARSAVDFLFRESRGHPRLKILFFGGESLLEYDLLRETVEYAEAKAAGSGREVVFNMTTNAVLLDGERCEYLSRHRVKYLVSIDGPREVHDRHRRRPDGKSSYESIAGKVPLLRRYQPWLGARVTVHPDTAGALAGSFSHLAELGFSQFLIGPASGVEWTDRDLGLYRDGMIEVARRLKDLLDRGRQVRVNSLEEDLKTRGGKRHYRGCRAGRQSVTVSAEGLIYPCSKMVGVMGRAGLQPLGSLEEGITAVNDRLRYCGLVPLPEGPCPPCPRIDICTGGCFAVNWQETGDIFRPAPFECRLQERTVEIIESAEPILGPGYFEKAAAAARKRNRATP